ncbi:hypothetical protein GCM10011369_20510 [Neiella marina]|uniref:Methyltransferase FkbM domain-containing protein n=1 Tax=Neiella marina TaxID=508461 RepID=A0A8J2U5E4_9GAMM|nr:FkbM family methyltransferase [Neiella marina]GGA78510.1 hypothetical protein GCM10011369_20510 [Neiella marina]
MSSITGSFIIVAPYKLAGWVWDESDPNVRCSVEVHVNDSPVAKLDANSKRQDLADSGIGDGCYAFFLDLDDYLVLGENTINVYADNIYELDYRNNRVEVTNNFKLPKFDPFFQQGLTLRRTKFGHLVLNGLDRGVDEALLEYGEWGVDEVDVFGAILSEGDIALDVGANLGASGLPMSKIVGNSGQVHCFEPQRYNFYRLCAHILMNQAENITPHNVAVGADSGSKVKIPAIDYSKIHSSGSVSVTHGRNGNYEVDCISLSDFCFEHDIQPSLIKVDVEGFEVNVIKGAQRLCERYAPAVYFECHAHSDFESIYNMLKSCNSDYQFYWHVARIFSNSNFNRSERDIYNGGGLSFNVLASVNPVDDINQPGFVPVASVAEFWPEERFPLSFRNKINIVKGEA